MRGIDPSRGRKWGGESRSRGRAGETEQNFDFYHFFFKIKKSEAEALNADNVDSIFLKWLAALLITLMMWRWWQWERWWWWWWWWTVPGQWRLRQSRWWARQSEICWVTKINIIMTTNIIIIIVMITMIMIIMRIGDVSDCKIHQDTKLFKCLFVVVHC